MKRIIVTGSGGPAGLNFLNSLRDAPERMYLIGADINKYHLEWPNVDERYLVPRSSAPTYIDKLNEIVEKTKGEFIHPQPDSEVRVLSENREKLKARTYLPKKETIEICQDKFKLAERWRDVGLLVGDTLLIKTEKNLKEAEKIFGYPYWLRASVGFSSRGSTLVHNI